MAIMGQACCKWRSIIECEWFPASRKLDLSLEGFDLFPSFQYGLLLFGKVDRHDSKAWKCVMRSRNRRAEFNFIFDSDAL